MLSADNLSQLSVWEKVVTETIEIRREMKRFTCIKYKSINNPAPEP